MWTDKPHRIVLIDRDGQQAFSSLLASSDIFPRLGKNIERIKTGWNSLLSLLLLPLLHSSFEDRLLSLILFDREEIKTSDCRGFRSRGHSLLAKILDQICKWGKETKRRKLSMRELGETGILLRDALEQRNSLDNEWHEDVDRNTSAINRQSLSSRSARSSIYSDLFSSVFVKTTSDFSLIYPSPLCDQMPMIVSHCNGTDLGKVKIKRRVVPISRLVSSSLFDRRASLHGRLVISARRISSVEPSSTAREWELTGTSTSKGKSQWNRPVGDRFLSHPLKLPRVSPLIFSSFLFKLRSFQLRAHIFSRSNDEANESERRQMPTTSVDVVKKDDEAISKSEGGQSVRNWKKPGSIVFGGDRRGRLLKREWRSPFPLRFENIDKLRSVKKEKWTDVRTDGKAEMRGIEINFFLLLRSWREKILFADQRKGNSAVAFHW